MSETVTVKIEINGVVYPVSCMAIIGTEAMPIEKGTKFVAILPRYLCLSVDNKKQ